MLMYKKKKFFRKPNLYILTIENERINMKKILSKFYLK
jgi:hypothetical protein